MARWNAKKRGRKKGGRGGLLGFWRDSGGFRRFLHCSIWNQEMLKKTRKMGRETKYTGIAAMLAPLNCPIPSSSDEEEEDDAKKEEEEDELHKKSKKEEDVPEKKVKEEEKEEPKEDKEKENASEPPEK
ncbi:hypothetical protein GCK72_004007 [Caenorhabditis remanei]|uniref:Uncharacterized protein n=1 Tax=Caenorhabditis remanei TaxID=31234 RepID=A0A6A5HB08_CAERE|nr:hypothetical protein GCK72_004007 [Caenorhabditis remanei]KAF1764061.1 hypothetical protein GCK72_004007 [Caenorhabditis remanei]